MAEIKRVTGRCMNREDELSLHRRADFKGHKPSNRTAAWHISILFEPTWTCGHDSGLFLTSYFNSKIAFIKVRKRLFLFKILEFKKVFTSGSSTVWKKEFSSDLEHAQALHPRSLRIFSLFFGDRILLYSPGFTGTCYID